MRIIGMDIHRVAAEAVALLDGKLEKLGRIPILRERLEDVDCRWEVTRYFHRELTRAKLCPALRVLGQEIGFSFLTLGAVVFVLALARKRKLSLPVSRI